MVDFRLNTIEAPKAAPITHGDVVLSPRYYDQLVTLAGDREQALLVDGVTIDAITRCKTPFGQVIGLENNQALALYRPKATNGAMIDVSDGWAFFELSGGDADAVITRLTPVDLRNAKSGAVYDTQLGQYSALLVVEDGGFEIGIGSSYAQSFTNDVENVMRIVAALSLHRQEPY